jgi:hypothetical protein
LVENAKGAFFAPLVEEKNRKIEAARGARFARLVESAKGAFFRAAS